MDAVLQSLTLYMMIGIVIVIAVSQVNRFIGSLLGIAFWAAVAFVGSHAYDKGNAIGIPNYPFPRPLFYLICAIFMLFSAGRAYTAYHRQQRQPRVPEDEDDGEGEG